MENKSEKTKKTWYKKPGFIMVVLFLAFCLSAVWWYSSMKNLFNKAGIFMNLESDSSKTEFRLGVKKTYQKIITAKVVDFQSQKTELDGASHYSGVAVNCFDGTCDSINFTSIVKPKLGEQVNLKPILGHQGEIIGWAVVLPK